MAKELDFKIIAQALIGEEPLDYKYRPESDLLSVINQIGQKFIFTRDKWQEMANIAHETPKKEFAKGDNSTHNVPKMPSSSPKPSRGRPRSTSQK